MTMNPKDDLVKKGTKTQQMWLFLTIQWRNMLWTNKMDTFFLLLQIFVSIIGCSLIVVIIQFDNLLYEFFVIL